MATSKGKNWSDLLGGSPKTAAPEPEKPAQPPVTVLMHTIVGNPDNPRPEEDYTDADPEFRDLKASMKEIGQLQPLAVVSRPVFEQAKPDAITQAPAKTRKLIQEADWVVVTGNRRLAAARQLGWTRIDIRVQDQLGDEEGRIDEAVIIENIHRKNLAPIKEAEFLAGMLERYGSQEKVAERIGKSQVYVSQRLALLKLAPDIREEVDAGTLKIKEARQLAGRTTDHDEQRAQVAELKRQAAEPKAPRSRAKPELQNPVLNPSTVTAEEGSSKASAGVVRNPVLNPDPVQDRMIPEPARGMPAEQQVPEQRSEQTPADHPEPFSQGVVGGKPFPYDNGTEMFWHVIRKAPTAELVTLTRLLNQHARENGLNVDSQPAS